MHFSGHKLIYCIPNKIPFRNNVITMCEIFSYDSSIENYSSIVKEKNTVFSCGLKGNNPLKKIFTSDPKANLDSIIFMENIQK